MDINSNIFLTGHNGMLGRAIHRKLKENGYKKIITVNKKELDLRNEHLVTNFFSNNNIDIVILFVRAGVDVCIFGV